MDEKSEGLRDQHCEAEMSRRINEGNWNDFVEYLIVIDQFEWSVHVCVLPNRYLSACIRLFLV